MYEKNIRLVCKKATPYGIEVGDTGTCVYGSDYVPGLDAGRWTVEPDNYPEASPYNHNFVNYWTEYEMLETWEVIPSS